MITAKVDITKEHHAKNICRPTFRSSPKPVPQVRDCSQARKKTTSYAGGEDQ